MTMTYLGHLQRNDPLYGYIYHEIQGQLDLWGNREYRVFKMHASNNVFLYEDTETGRRFIGKFYYDGYGGNRAEAHDRMEREFANLNWLRSQGFDGRNCHYIARPLGRNSALNELLLEEYCYGTPLSAILKQSIQENNDALLFQKLTALAYFLSKLHNHTANGYGVNFNPITDYATGMADTLFHRGWISEHRRWVLGTLFATWHDRSEMWADNQVVVHGDATPENFTFGDGLHVISFDLERLRRADRMFDLGRLAAEISHFFMLYAGNRNAAEPFLGHLLWEYSCHFPDREATFRSITARLPFYMGINFLRIARNDYFDWNYRQQLLNAASESLKGGLA